MASFLDNLDKDIKQNLIAQIRDLWTHTSTAIEGNTLTLGETAFVIAEGLTISGKPLKDHEEVVGHARAIDLLYTLVNEGRDITEDDLFLLHSAIQIQKIHDTYKPIGNWKKEPNGAYVVNAAGKQVYVEYASPKDIPELMRNWLALLNGMKPLYNEPSKTVQAYAKLHVSFAHIHPFFDGNGRMTRLLANIPVLRSGFPPILIPKEQRKTYIQLLSEYELTVGMLEAKKDVLPKPKQLKSFIGFCEKTWQTSLDLVQQAQQTQSNRNK